ncbi:PREDICTED: cold-regulated 413 plasma membrane protein 4-like [Camelina sativa]|uniref:Cold-regulated 413 plasma membrane protein 4-like n=1 Tax=Camelina sativa TaxID=90675 RepID=A0ABM0U7Y3_CAMSA|nr:PREDICTED: cold-regulated 413 plasma membrane protein 4-like [Camelina sativa]
MGRVEYLAMKTSEETTANLINSDLNEFVAATKKLVKDVRILGGLGFGTSFLQWAASISAIYLLILDRTNWRTKMLTSLLVPYIFFTLPTVIFHFFSGDFGKWIALIAITIRLFFPKEFPEWLEIPAALILLLVVAPRLIAETLRENWVGAVICLAIACYLFHEHVKASGGFKKCFTEKHGISNTLGIVALLVYPIWTIFFHIF